MHEIEPDRGPTAISLPAADESLTQRWYAVQTRPRHEKKVALQLKNRCVEIFLPLLSRIRHWSDRQKLVELPLFPGYAFVRMCHTNSNRLRILQTPGVLGFVTSAGRALPIPAREIENVQKVLLEKVPCWTHPFLRIGQRVRIRGGSLEGVQGILLASRSDRSLLISIEPVSQSLRINIEGYDVEPV